MTNNPEIYIFTTDANLLILSWDSNLAQATQIPGNTVCGQHLTTIIPDLAERGLLARFHRVLTEGVIETLAPAFHHYLIPCPPPAGAKYFDKMQQRVTITPLREGSDLSDISNKRITGTIVTIEDVTARLERERDLALQLASPNESDRVRAVKELANKEKSTETQIEATEEKPPLMLALGDESWRVRRVAVDSIAVKADTSTTAMLLRTLREEHRNLSVLNSALQVLALSDIDVVAPLIEFLQDPDEELRTYAALALGDRKDPRSVPALIATIQNDPDTNVRYHSIEALGKLRPPEATEALLAIAESRDFFLGFPALDALRQIGDTSIAPRLVPLLADSLLCAPTAVALGLLGDQEVVKPLVQLLNQANAPTRAIAQSLAALYNRYETVYGEGPHITDLFKEAITLNGCQNLLDALSLANPEELKSLVLLLGWVDNQESAKALTKLLSEPAVRKEVVEALVRYGEGVSELLMEQLESHDLETRYAAVVALGRIGDTRAVGILTRLLKADPELVIAAADALARIGDRSAFEALLELLGHQDAGVRQAAIAALNSLGHPDMPEKLQTLLINDNPYLRESAVKIAGYFAFAECLELFLQSCQDTDERVRRAAIEHLPYLTENEQEIMPILAAALARETAKVRAAAARALAQIDSSLAFPYLKTAIADTDPWVRYYAARSIGIHGYPEALEDLAHLVQKDPANQVRAAAVEGLGRIGGRGAVTILAPFALGLTPTGSDDGDLTRAAIRALGNIGHPDALPLLLNVLRSPIAPRRIDACTALGGRGGQQAVDALQWIAASDPDPQVVQAAIEALAKMCSAESIAALIELIADHQRVNACVAVLVRLNGQPRVSLEQLIEWIGRGLNHPHAGVRCAVIEILTRLKHPRASELLIFALADKDASVRLYAVRSLQHLGNRYAEEKLSALARTDPDAGVRRAAQKLLQT